MFVLYILYHALYLIYYTFYTARLVRRKCERVQTLTDNKARSQHSLYICYTLYIVFRAIYSTHLDAEYLYNICTVIEAGFAIGPIQKQEQTQSYPHTGMWPQSEAHTLHFLQALIGAPQISSLLKLTPPRFIFTQP